MTKKTSGTGAKKPTVKSVPAKSPLVKRALPYAVPRTIEPALAKVRAYWDSLKRGQNEIPFADDLKMSGLAALSGRLTLIESFKMPARFRFNIVGARIERLYGKELSGIFVDEIEAGTPLEYLNSQCSATTAAGTPTYFRHIGPRAYSRILLPMWSDGHIGMLLGAIAEAK